MGDRVFTHLSREDRQIIHAGILNGSSKAAIAETLGKDKSTIGKEIKQHRVTAHICSYPLECKNGGKCRYNHNCSEDCPGYELFTCTRRDRSPGACNGCKKLKPCRYTKYLYDPIDAHNEYRALLSSAREGADLSAEQAREIGNIVRPLLKNGQSPYQILINHPELGISEKTLYTYIENGVLSSDSGSIGPIDLRRQVSRKMSKKKAQSYKKREDKKYLKGRTHDDYLATIAETPGVHVVQMDTVYNDVSNGPFVQTFKFLDAGLLFAIYHEKKNAQTMKEGVDLLEEILGTEVFRKHVYILLTDRGTEFSDAEGMEHSSDGSIRTRVFYCDPMRSNQKGSLENKHIELRYILPSECDLRALGLTDQNALTRALRNVNSAPLQHLGGKSALELTQFLYEDLYVKFHAYGMTPVEKDAVLLTPLALRG